MSDPQEFAATMIDSAIRAYAVGTVERQSESMKGAADRLSDESFVDPISDTHARLAHLAEALALRCPAIFEEFLRWSKAGRHARGWSDEGLVGNLDAMREVLEARLPATAAGAAGDLINRGIEFYREAPSDSYSIIGDAESNELTLQFLEAILSGRSHRALQLVNDAVENGLSPQNAYVDVVTTAQREVGRLWQIGQLDIGEEHIGSRIVERVLFELMRRVEAPSADAPKVLVTCGAANQHEIAPRIVADQFTLSGWNAFFLGSQIPASSLAITAAEFDADLIAISIPLSIQLRPTRALIQDLRESMGDKCPPILVGGPPFGIDGRLGELIGADAATHQVLEGPELGRRLVERARS